MRPIKSPEVVAIVKGLFSVGISAKQIAQNTKIPYSTIAAWCYCRRATNIQDSKEPRIALAHMYQKVIDILAEEKGQASERDGAPNVNVPAASEAKPSDTREPGSL